MKRAATDQQGFTLIEVLIALALLAMLSVMSWQALDLTDRSSRRLNANANDRHGVVRVLGQIESDIGKHAGNDVLPSLIQADRAALTGAMLPSGLLWVAPVLTIARSAQDGAWQKIAWGRDGDTLRRAVGPVSNTLPLPDAQAGEVVLEHVRNFTVRGWVPGQGWSTPDLSEIQPAATGMEIVIERRRDGVDESYRKVVMLP